MIHSSILLYHWQPLNDPHTVKRAGLVALNRLQDLLPTSHALSLSYGQSNLSYIWLVIPLCPVNRHCVTLSPSDSIGAFASHTVQYNTFRLHVQLVPRARHRPVPLSAQVCRAV
jgi:hypothetical protein